MDDGSGGSDSLGGGGSSGNGDSAAEEYQKLYAETILPTFELTIPDRCFDQLSNPSNRSDEYCSGGLSYRLGDEGEDNDADATVTLTNVGIRLKGSASFRPLGQKAGFKIKTDEFVEGQRILGLRRITLNNMVQDPSVLHERLGYRFYRAAGVPAPLANHARVYVNGEYYGLYANVQSIDDEFAEKLWDAAPGNLYDIPSGEYFYDLLPEYLDRFQLETNTEANDRSDLEALITAVNGPQSSFVTNVESVLDLEEWLAAGAAQAIIADWDGYFGARNNYKLYHELDRDRFIVLPWGIDQTFGKGDDFWDDPLLHHLDYPIDHSRSEREPGRVFQQCQRSTTCWQRYLDAVEAALAVFESLPLENEVDAMIEQTAAALSEDDMKEYEDDTIERAREGLRTFLADRPGRVRENLADYGR